MTIIEFRQISEDLPVAERSVFNRFIVSFILAAGAFLITYSIYSSMGHYFPSLTIICAVLIALYSGPFISIAFVFLLSLAADYSFIPPVGYVLSSREGLEHFFIIVSLAILVACLGSLLRDAFRQIVLAKQEAERASILMEKVPYLVSHDIRSPLSGMMMGSEFILKTPGQTEKHQPILAMMLRSGEQIDSMIETLLDAASIRAGKIISLDFKTCDLSVGMSLSLLK